MKLSARTRYAARILLDLAVHADGNPIRTARLSKHTGITVQFIEQIIRPLKQEDFVRSVRGANGGHILKADPADITLGHIVRVMEGGINLTPCVPDATICSRSDSCGTRNAWVSASKALERELDGITIAALMQEKLPARSLIDDEEDVFN